MVNNYIADSSITVIQNAASVLVVHPILSRITPSIINPCCRSPLCSPLPWQSPAQGETPQSAKNERNKIKSKHNVEDKVYVSVFSLESLFLYIYFIRQEKDRQKRRCAPGMWGCQLEET